MAITRSPMAYEAQGEKLQAALSYVKVYYAYPNTDLAANSWDAMTRLRGDLGKDFPTAPARQQLDRCRKWLDAKQYANARAEYTALAQSLPEPDRNEARVGIGAARIPRRRYRARRCGISETSKFPNPRPRQSGFITSWKPPARWATTSR